MPFYQLHYTSCKMGISGHSGFQFSAMSPDVPTEVMREVERLTVYEQPRLTREAGQSLDPDLFPTNLLYTYSEVTGLTIIAQVRFAGLDFSNRSGNYFAHSLITGSPADDLQDVFPAELWDASFWDSQRGDVTELPLLGGPLPPGPITRQVVSRFLTASPENEEILPLLLTAADEAIGGDDRVLLVGPDSVAVCHWIAAVSYLLGPKLAGQLRFSTYSHEPRRCPTHIVGTVSAAGPFRADAITSYRLFDVGERNTVDIRPSAAASLLARTGIEASARLWDTAASLGTPATPSLTGWFPMLASAALILEHPVLPDELDAAIDWLAAGGRIPDAGRLASAVRAALEHPIAQLTAARQQQLVQLGHRADGQIGDSGSTLAIAVERAVVASMVRGMERGESPGEGFPLQTQGAVRMASEGCSRLLRNCDAESAVHLLAWASVSGAHPDPDAVRQVGRQLARHDLRNDKALPGLPAVAAAWPVLRAGMVGKLAALPDDQQDRVLSGPMAGMLRRADFADHPGLYEKWLIALVRSGQMTPTAGLAHIMELRRRSGNRAAVDDALLMRLWSGQGWTFAEAAGLLNHLQPAELAVPAVAARLVPLLGNQPGSGELSDWITFITAFTRHFPPPALPHGQMKQATELSRVAELIHVTTQRSQNATDRAIDELLTLYGTCTPVTQRFHEYHLPSIMIRYSRFAIILRCCPELLLLHFSSYARGVIQGRGDQAVLIAARIFVAVRDLRDSKSVERAIYLEENILRPTLLNWRRSEIRMVAAEADQILRHGGRLLNDWYSQNTGLGRFFRLRGFS
jgi:hypothetical protein